MEILEEIKNLYNNRDNDGIIKAYYKNKLIVHVGYGQYKIEKIEKSCFNDIEIYFLTNHQIIISCDYIEYLEERNGEVFSLDYKI